MPLALARRPCCDCPRHCKRHTAGGRQRAGGRLCTLFSAAPLGAPLGPRGHPTGQSSQRTRLATLALVVAPLFVCPYSAGAAGPVAGGPAAVGAAGAVNGGADHGAAGQPAWHRAGGPSMGYVCPWRVGHPHAQWHLGFYGGHRYL